MRISCGKGYETRTSDSGTPVEGVTVTCSRCGASEFAFGTHRGSEKRCLVQLNEGCPKNENNFYEVDR